MPGTGDKNNKLKKFGRIGVLAGGPSNERDISLKSGRAVYEALKETGADVKLVFVSERFADEVKKEKMDTAFIALHGRFGEDGTVQRILKKTGISYTGSGPEASRLSLDKLDSRRAFEKADIPVPAYRIYKKGLLKDIDLNFPLIVKPQFEGSSIGLSLVEGVEQLASAIKKATGYAGSVIIEEFISGREITVGILGDRPLPVLEIAPKGKIYDFAAKYKSPDTRYLVPAPIKRPHFNKAQELGLRAHKILGCKSFSRVDMILGTDGRIYVLEVNSIPGLTLRSLLPMAADAVGISFKELCIKILESAIK